MGSYKTISRIAIIGGGPSGIACAKLLLAEKAFQKIDIFEQRDRVGGIWNLTSNDRTLRIPIPQLDPAYGSYHHLRESRKDADGINHESLEFESPLYDYLETNIPKQLMRYSDTPFPTDYPLFPDRQEVLQYLQDHAADVKHLIRFDTQVQDARLLSNIGRGQSTWEISTKNMKLGRIERDTYDAIVVATGHYTVPQTPDVEGLAQWNAAFPGVNKHSKAYRKPEDFKHKRVLVIGNSASGLDIAAQIGQHSEIVYLSSRSETIFGQTTVEGREDIDEVVEFLGSKDHDRAIRTKAGKVITHLDAVIFATGYFYSFPFLSCLDPPIITDGLRTRNTYQHFIHIDHPEIAFPVINMKVIPFGLAENQAAVIARLWSGRLSMPSYDEMRKWEEEEINLKGSGKHFHVQKFPGDGLQMNELYRWAQSANKDPNLDNDGDGKLGMMWDERQVWLRSNFPAIRAAYNKRGNEKRMVKTPEELGFHFDEWRKHATSEEMQMFREAKCQSGET